MTPYYLTDKYMSVFVPRIYAIGLDLDSFFALVDRYTPDDLSEADYAAAMEKHLESMEAQAAWLQRCFDAHGLTQADMENPNPSPEVAEKIDMFKVAATVLRLSCTPGTLDTKPVSMDELYAACGVPEWDLPPANRQTT